MADGDALVMNAVLCPFDAVLRRVLADFFAGEGHEATAAVLRSDRGEDAVRTVYAVCDRIGRRPDPFAVRAVCEVLIPLDDRARAEAEERRRDTREAFEAVRLDAADIPFPLADGVHVG